MYLTTALYYPKPKWLGNSNIKYKMEEIGITLPDKVNKLTLIKSVHVSLNLKLCVNN